MIEFGNNFINTSPKEGFKKAKFTLKESLTYFTKLYVSLLCS